MAFILRRGGRDELKDDARFRGTLNGLAAPHHAAGQ